jgi:hypothetical protein
VSLAIRCDVYQTVEETPRRINNFISPFVIMKIVIKLSIGLQYHINTAISASVPWN